jgi:hypothetical protein
MRRPGSLFTESDFKPMTIDQARETGYVDFTFYPTAQAATEAAITRRIETGRRVISFDEPITVGKQNFVLHVMGETSRPRPVVKIMLPEPIRRRGEHKPKLDAFAVFIAEWAAKLRRVVA